MELNRLLLGLLDPPSKRRCETVAVAQAGYVKPYALISTVQNTLPDPIPTLVLARFVFVGALVASILLAS